MAEASVTPEIRQLPWAQRYQRVDEILRTNRPQNEVTATTLVVEAGQQIPFAGQNWKTIPTVQGENRTRIAFVPGSASGREVVLITALASEVLHSPNGFNLPAGSGLTVRALATQYSTGADEQTPRDCEVYLEFTGPGSSQLSERFGKEFHEFLEGLRQSPISNTRNPDLSRLLQASGIEDRLEPRIIFGSTEQPPLPDYYQLLGLQPDAQTDKIQSAIKERIGTIDVNRFDQLAFWREASEILTNADRRADYDRQRGLRPAELFAGIINESHYRLLSPEMLPGEMQLYELLSQMYADYFQAVNDKQPRSQKTLFNDCFSIAYRIEIANGQPVLKKQVTANLDGDQPTILGDRSPGQITSLPDHLTAIRVRMEEIAFLDQARQAGQEVMGGPVRAETSITLLSLARGWHPDYGNHQWRTEWQHRQPQVGRQGSEEELVSWPISEPDALYTNTFSSWRQELETAQRKGETLPYPPADDGRPRGVRFVQSASGNRIDWGSPQPSDSRIIWGLPAQPQNSNIDFGPEEEIVFL